MINRIRPFFASLYVASRFFIACGGVTLLFVLAFFIDWIESVALTALFALIGFTLVDAMLLFMRKGVVANRSMHDRLSNGDDNQIEIHIWNSYAFRVQTVVVDELPFQFQLRDASHRCSVEAGNAHQLRYTLRPTQRGEYSFGALNIYASSPIAMLQRRYRFAENSMVPVYPSYLQMRKYELMAATNRLTEVGVKRIRRVGLAREFDQIRDYVPGDEYRTINWNATARHGDLLVNQYQEEKSQSVYSIIDMGRSMKMPFEGLTLLDYSINASLVISNIAMMKDDKAGLITFNENIESVLKAERGPAQMNRILQQLYKQRTSFREPNYEMLYAVTRRTIHQRSLLLLFTNFETLSSMKRQLPTLSMLAASHVLCVIFFENTELHSLLETPAHTLQDVYIQTIAEKFSFEKKLICSELERRGIHTIFTAPQKLSVNTINAYLQLKARGAF